MSTRSAISIVIGELIISTMSTHLRSLTLFVVRHGECEHNLLGRAAARDDSPLTERGRDQARASGKLLIDLIGSPEGFDWYASPLHRACVTMEIVRESAGLLAHGYRADRRLMEGDLGDHTWLPAAEMLNHPEFLADPWNYVRPDGESQAMVHARVGKFLATLKRNSILVAHALTVNMIRMHYLGLTPGEILGSELPHAKVLRLTGGVETLFG